MLNTVLYYYSRFGVSGLIQAIKAKLGNRNTLLKVERGELKFPFYIRLRTSDLPTYDQVFLRKDYDFDVNEAPRVIIDAGANIGLASIFFAHCFPNTKIFALEPERSNFDLLESNVSPYPNVVPIHAALWHIDEEINLIDPGRGKWAFMTEMKNGSELAGDTCHTVEAMTVDTLMKKFDLDQIDILKIDIEGAEREVFSDSALWIDKVDSIIVELHERMKVGCNRSFYNGSNGFDHEWQQGENVYLTKGKCVLSPTKGA